MQCIFVCFEVCVFCLFVVVRSRNLLSEVGIMYVNINHLPGLTFNMQSPS